MQNKSAEIKAKSARYSLWYRMYVEIIDDPKTALLSDRHGWGWVRLLAIAKRSPGGFLPPIPDLAFYMRCSRTDVENLVNDLIEFGLLDIVEMQGTTPTIRPHNWDGRQFQWDGRDLTQDERKRRSRSRKRHGHGQVTVEVTEVRSVSVSESVSSLEDSSIQERIDATSTGEVLP
jgi:hypothetical protein